MRRTEPSHPTRRSLLSTAWAVPVITVAAAAPAVAASPNTVRGRLRFTYLTGFFADYDTTGRPRSIVEKFGVLNEYVEGGPTIVAVTVTLTYPASRIAAGAVPTVQGTGWSFTGSRQVGGSRLIDLTWSGSAPPGKALDEAEVTLPLADRTPGTIQVSAVASAPSAEAAAISSSVVLN